MAHQRAYTDDHGASVELLAEVARQYYERFMTQAEIAQNIGVSRSQISRYLKAAQEAGIVQITIAVPATSDPELEGELRSRFKQLREVTVTPTTSSSTSSTVLSRVAAAGAVMLQKLVQPDDTVSVGAGRTLAQLVTALEPRKQDGVVVVQAMGNVGHEGHDIDYNAIAHGVATAFGGRSFQINAPAILSPPYVAANMESSHASIGNAVSRARKADVFVIGLGTLASDTLFVSTGLLTDDDIEAVGQSDPAGDICGRFYDHKGKPIVTPFDDRIVGIRLEDLKKARAVLAVASGAEKATPMLGALRGGYLTHVSTDDVVAREILEQLGRKR
jgi:deoxyribonucleoside regulator